MTFIPEKMLERVMRGLSYTIPHKASSPTSASGVTRYMLHGRGKKKTICGRLPTLLCLLG